MKRDSIVTPKKVRNEEQIFHIDSERWDTETNAQWVEVGGIFEKGIDKG